MEKVVLSTLVCVLLFVHPFLHYNHLVQPHQHYHHQQRRPHRAFIKSPHFHHTRLRTKLFLPTMVEIPMPLPSDIVRSTTIWETSSTRNVPLPTTIQESTLTSSTLPVPLPTTIQESTLTSSTLPVPLPTTIQESTPSSNTSVLQPAVSSQSLIQQVTSSNVTELQCEDLTPDCSPTRCTNDGQRTWCAKTCHACHLRLLCFNANGDEDCGQVARSGLCDSAPFFTVICKRACVAC